jgi:hypothetical protein
MLGPLLEISCVTVLDVLSGLLEDSDKQRISTQNKMSFFLYFSFNHKNVRLDPKSGFWTKPGFVAGNCRSTIGVRHRER